MYIVWKYKVSSIWTINIQGRRSILQMRMRMTFTNKLWTPQDMGHVCYRLVIGQTHYLKLVRMGHTCHNACLHAFYDLHCEPHHHFQSLFHRGIHLYPFWLGLDFKHGINHSIEENADNNPNTILWNLEQKNKLL